MSDTFARASRGFFRAPEPLDLDPPAAPVGPGCQAGCTERTDCRYCLRPVCAEHPGADTAEPVDGCEGTAHHGCHRRHCADPGGCFAG